MFYIYTEKSVKRVWTKKIIIKIIPYVLFYRDF